MEHEGRECPSCLVRSEAVACRDPWSRAVREISSSVAALHVQDAKVVVTSPKVDRLAGQVSALESVISKGGKVAEKTMLNLIELLMNQLLKLDGIMAEGDVKLQRKMQVKRVQKYVETLDVLKVKNSAIGSNEQPVTPNVQNHEQRHSNRNGAAAMTNQHQPPFPNSRR
nr:BAG family molecular chaperone regulator 1 [Tanacetum cinerariifolium]